MLPPTIATTDYHTGGEPFRIVVDLPVAIPGPTVAERRVRALRDPDVQGLRAVLCSEPRGHADMYGGFLVPPDDAGAHLGVLFWHKDGFSTACGHGTIALGAWAVETGRVAAPVTGSVDVVIDVPSGRVTARVHREGGRVVAVDFVNVPSWVIASEVPVPTSRGEVRVTVAYGGAIYATLPAAQLRLSVTPEHLGDLITLGREIKRALNDSVHAVHPTDPRLTGVYGTIWFDELGDGEGQVHQRNVTVFADGEVDRSPCGSGTCARLAVLAADGRLPNGTVLRHDSIVGSTFTGTVLGTVDVDGRPAVTPQVSGMAYRTGEHVFSIDPHDPLVPGFVLR
ncbi:proline racemase family protein [Geodermatophilus obscurus]|uniref:Proline racemase n=1 Tax=Geodermatophilus obscurus (strain ATCC 25078 / DSM 43160 / JCM 3152 / CCUG 61914 / KCC A-0152 / KCTC 9177 / NBRC 13315 / NRRL B-3577 / G-20) TaxID=526225 RepID=D2SH03_GEOOG|nr:proline racemase family protein [Geodermatophilus obscurus]ADB74996.1 Proline racemase [Geodermatophilus obscurus DSM 43160]